MLLVGAVQRGLSMQDFTNLTIGQVVDYCIEYNNAQGIQANDNTDIIRQATQADWDSFLT